MPSQKLVLLETEIATLLLKKLEHLEITPQRAAEIAKFTLAALPENLTDEQVDKIIPSLDDRYFELAEIVAKYIKEYENANIGIVRQEATKLIHEGKMQEASRLMNQYFSKQL